MREDGDLRPLVQTLGSAAVGVGLGLGILVAGFFISRLTLADSTTVVAASIAPATATRSPSPSPRPTTTPAPTPAPTLAPTLPPAPTPDPLVVTAYSGQGLRLAALTIPANYTVTSPITGKVTIKVYQFIDGSIREGAEGAGVSNYPYIFVKSADREIKLRPGAIDTDVQLLVKDGDIVTAGSPLFKTLTAGASSWALFYDSAVKAQVMATVTAQPSGNELDPVPVFKK